MSHITEEQRLAMLASNVVLREKEVFQYQVNIDNYTAMVAALPAGDPPARLVQYVGMSADQLPLDMPLADVQVLMDIAYRDRLRRLLRTEAIEQRKAQLVMDALKAQIPPARYDELIAAALQ